MTLSISTIVLNWNRAELLDRCLQSLLETTPDFQKCIIIDNNSSDHSRDVIEKWARQDERLLPLLKPENRGAEWINEAAASISSDLIYIIANDKVMLPGWLEYTRKAFTAFAELGQIALHAPAPLDNEVWQTKPARYEFRNGVGLYVAENNTGMSSVLRRSVLNDHNITFGNLPGVGGVHLPDDGQLSLTIKQAGMICAWSDRYYVLNAGHTIEEFKNSPQYYDDNYQAKPWLLREGLARRIEGFHTLPKPFRTSRIFGWEGIPECELVNSGHLAPRIWSLLDGGGPELEFADFVYSYTRLIKPANVAVVRGWNGFIPVAVARALRDNSTGSAFYYEPDATLDAATKKRLRDSSLESYCSLANGNVSLDNGLLIVSGYFDDKHLELLLDAIKKHIASASHLIVKHLPQLRKTMKNLDDVFDPNT